MFVPCKALEVQDLCEGKIILISLEREQKWTQNVTMNDWRFLASPLDVQKLTQQSKLTIYCQGKTYKRCMIQQPNWL